MKGFRKKQLLPASVLLVVVSVLAGCIKSVHPLYTSKDLLHDPALLGRWHMKDEHDIWEFEPRMEELLGDEKAPFYLLAQEDGDKRGNFAVGLVRLGEHLFLDFYPYDYYELEQKGVSSLMVDHLMGVHSFAKVNVRGDTLEIHPFNGEWLSDLLSEGRIRIAHEETPTSMLLTASTEDLQKFVTKYADEPQAFGDKLVLIKQGADSSR